MKFNRIIGKIDSALILKAEENLSGVMLELGLRPDNNQIGSRLGGDPLIWSLTYPMQHVATLNIPTAGTDGKRYYWNPKFICSKSRTGLRIVCAHEAWHAIYMHPLRRGSRHPKLWNIAVDFIVNWTIMEDIKCRKQDPILTFKNELGNYVTLEAYADHLRNPFVKIHGSEDWVPEPYDADEEKINLPKIDDDRELTDQEKKELQKRDEKIKYFYADPNLPENMRRPEKIYDYLYSLLPKCSKCGSIGLYQFPIKNIKKESDSKNDTKCCDQCGGGYDIFDFGDTLDEHMDSSESQEKLAKRIADAMESSRRMAGSVPAALEAELGLLIAPKVRWQDFLRAKISKTRDGNSKNDWTRFRTRPLFTGLMIPKKINQVCTFGCLLDTSGSMSVSDMTFGVSQLQSIDERSEGWVVPADSEIYWKKATKLKKINATEISQIKIVGRGGTKYAEFFKNYKKEIGKCDFLIVITDGFLDDIDIAEMVAPEVDVVWLITSGASFTQPFGRVFDLKD